MEIDYGQLEVVGLAVLTGDIQLTMDLVKGVDIHTALFEDMYGHTPTKAERKPFKSRTFQLVYGASATAIAEQAGISKAEGDKFVETFYKRYKGVKTWHESVKKKVESGRKPSPYKDEMGYPVGTSTYICPFTHRRYVFKEYIAPEWLVKTGKTHSFSPTEMKNYPAQGFATGDVVPMMLGVVFRALQANDVLKNKCLMINTVHDSMMFDVHDSVREEAVDFVRSLIENTPKYFFERFGMVLPFAKFSCGVSVGRNWFDQTEVK